MVINGLLLFASLALAVQFFADVISQSPVVQQVSLPNDLKAVGYTPEGSAAAIRVEAQRLTDEALMTKHGMRIRSADTQVDLQLPGATFSLKGIGRSMRQFLGFPDRAVSGEVRQIDGGKLVMDLLIGGVDGPTSVVRKLVDATDMPTLIGKAARAVVEVYSPLLMAEVLLAEADQKCVLDSDCTRYEAARTMYLRAVEHASDPSEGWLARWMNKRASEIRMARLGIAESWRQDDRDRALEKIDALLRDEKQFALAHSLRGQVLASNRDYDEAFAAFERAARLDRKDASIRGNWGLALHEADRYDEAIAQHRLALEQNPRLSVVHSNWGFSLLYLEKFDEAIERFQRAVAVNDGEWSAWLGWGEALRRSGDPDEALKKLERAAKLAPKYPEIMVQRAVIHSELGHHDEALKEALRALRESPDHVHAHYRAALAYAALGRHGRAVEHFEEVIRSEERFDPLLEPARPYLDYADSLRALRFTRRAIEVLQKGVEGQPNAAELYVQLGASQLALKRFVEAQATLRKAISLNARSGLAHCILANALDRAGNGTEAAAIREQGRKLGVTSC